MLTKLVDNIKEITQLAEMKKIESQLDSYIAKGQFFIVLQPKFDTMTEKVVGAEALIRKKENDRIIYPDEFLPIYEETGLITKLDMFVLEEVCKLQKSWKQRNFSILPISINESRHHLKNPNHIKELKAILEKYQADSHYIELEMTEQTVAEDLKKSKLAEEHAHELGFVISMDDFGSGYSAFNILKDIPIDILKIDKLFFSNLLSNRRAMIIVEAIVEMCKKLHIKTVAEGIETKEQVDFLKQIHCDMIQGYYFEKPIAVSRFEGKYLKNEN